MQEAILSASPTCQTQLWPPSRQWRHRCHPWLHCDSWAVPQDWTQSGGRCSEQGARGGNGRPWAHSVTSKEHRWKWASWLLPGSATPRWWKHRLQVWWRAVQAYLLLSLDFMLLQAHCPTVRKPLLLISSWCHLCDTSLRHDLMSPQLELSVCEMWKGVLSL